MAGLEDATVKPGLSPSQVEGMVAKIAQEQGVDPDLAVRIAKQESGFNPLAVSKQGARGVMQLMPGTAQDMGVTDVHDPVQNITGGVKYLAMLNKQFGGNEDLVRAAYHSGPTMVAQGGLEALGPEGRNYVQKTAQNRGKQIASELKGGVTYGAPLTFDDAGEVQTPSGVTYGEPLYPPDTKPEAPKAERGEFMKGAIGGLMSADPKMFGAAVQGFGTMAKSEWLQNKGKEWQAIAAENAKDYEPKVGSIANVRTDGVVNAIGDFFTKYLPYQAGNALASMAPTIATGLMGAAAGGAIAGPPGAAVGGFAGTLLSGYPMNYGDIYSDALDDKGIQQAVKSGKLTDLDVAQITALAAVPITALDSWSLGKMGNALTAPVKKAIYQRVFAEMKAGGLREGTTEGLQQIISEAVQNQLGSDKTLKDSAIAVIDNAVGGLAGGVLTGGAAGAVQRVPEAAPPAPGAQVPPGAGTPAGGPIPPTAGPIAPSAPPAVPPPGSPPPGGTPGARTYPNIDSEGKPYRDFVSGSVVDAGERLDPFNPGRVYPAAGLSAIDQARVDAQIIKTGGDIPGADDARLKNATLLAVYGENAAVRHVIESPGDFSAIGDAMLAVAPTVERVRGAIGQNERSRDISDDILSAVDEIRQMKESGKSLAEVMAEGATHDISYEGQQLLQFLDENQGNPKALASFMESYLHEVEMATGVPSEVRGRAFDIIQERENARKEKEAALQKERKDQAFAKTEATANREKAVTAGKAREQEAGDRVLREIAIAKAAGSGITPGIKTAMQIALETAKPLKGKQNAKQAGKSAGNVQEAPAGSAAAGAGQDEAGRGKGAVPKSAQAGEQGNARSVRAVGDQPGVENANRETINRGAAIASEVAQAGTRNNPVIASKVSHINQAAAVASKQPSPAQKEANNYQKGYFRFANNHPLAWIGTVAIENARGSERTAADGSWTVKDMPYHYGHLQYAEGKDGDKADIAIGKDLDAENVYVIDQIDPDTKKFDETKSFAAFKSERAAINAYVRSFSDGKGRARIGAITPMTNAQFVARVQANNLKEAVTYGSVPRGTFEKPNPRAEAIANELKDEAVRQELQVMSDEAGWAEEGGRPLRDGQGASDEEIAAGMASHVGNVIGRTKWIPRASWWPDRPVKLREGQVRAAVRKALAGEVLDKKQMTTIEYMIEEAKRTIKYGEEDANPVEAFTPDEYGELDGLPEAAQDEAISLADEVDGEKPDNWNKLSDKEKENELDAIFGPSTRKATGGAQGSEGNAAQEVGSAKLSAEPKQRPPALQKLIDDQKAEQVRRIASIGEVGDIAIMRNEKGDRWYAILGNASDEGNSPYRIQHFDANGFSGHMVYASKDEAIKEAARDGYYRRDDGALDRMQNTPAFQRGLEAAEIIRRANARELTWEEANAEFAKIEERYKPLLEAYTKADLAARAAANEAAENKKKFDEAAAEKLRAGSALKAEQLDMFNTQGSLFSRAGTEPKEGIPPGFTIDERNRDKTQNLERQLRAQGANFTITPLTQRVLRNAPVTSDTERGKAASRSMAESIAGIFGKKIVWMRAEGPFNINGAVIQGGFFDPYIFLDVESEKPAHVVLGHELTHHMEVNAPDAYNRLIGAMNGLLRNHAEYRAERGIHDAISDEDIIKEMVGDLMGDNFADRRFWHLVAEQSGGAFQRIATAVKEWLDSVARLLKEAVGFGSNQFVNDVNKARLILAQALSDYARKVAPKKELESARAKEDYAANLALYLQEKTGSIFGRFEGKLSAEEQRNLFGRFIGKGNIIIDGKDEIVANRVRVAFGQDYDDRNVTSWKDLNSGEIRLSYAGPHATENSPSLRRSFSIAQELEALGKPMEKIRLATGWFKNKYDQKWRREISDRGTRLVAPITDFIESPLFGKETAYKLGGVFDSPLVYKLYPEARNIKFVVRKGFMDFNGLQGWFDQENNSIGVTPYAKNPESTIRHELQHWIQAQEGFATGGNADSVIEKLTDTQKQRLAEKMISALQLQLRSANEKLITAHKFAVTGVGERYVKAYTESNRMYNLAIDEPMGSPLRKEWITAYDAMNKVKSEMYSEMTDNPKARFSDLSQEQIHAAMQIQLAFENGKTAKDIIAETEKHMVELQKGVTKIQSGDPESLVEAIKKSGETHNLYLRIAGEIEARNVQARADMTLKQRKETEPLTSEKIPVEDAIVTYDSGGKSEETLLNSRVSQTQTIEFKEWFGDSKVVDSAGNPLVVYHGTPVDFAEFDLSKTWLSSLGDSGGLGAFFTRDPREASHYAGDRSGQVMPVYLALKNPYTITASDPLRYKITNSKRDAIAVRKQLESEGYDGAITYQGEYVAFRSEQIKSAIGNVGTFGKTGNLMLSRSPGTVGAALGSNAITNFVNAQVNSPTSLGIFKAFNTQYHKAVMLARKGLPQFKAVFDKMQDYLNDTNALSIHAEQQGQAIFREPKALKDFFGGAANDKDVQALGPWLHGGTLYGGASPMQGVVWTDAELQGTQGNRLLPRNAVPLTKEQVKLYHEARAVIATSIETGAKSVIFRHVKKYGVTFDKFDTLDKVVGDVKDQLNDRLNDAQIQRMLAEQNADDAFDTYQQAKADAAANPKDRQLRVAEENAKANYDNEQRALDIAQARIETLEALIGKPNDPGTLDKIQDTASKLIEHGYMPLKRFGSRTVTARDAQGKVKFFGAFDGTPLVPGSANYEMQNVANQIKELHPDWDVKTGVRDEESWKMFQGLSLDALENFLDFVDAETKAELERDPIIQEYLANSVNNRSVLKELVHRKGTPGFSKDVPRVLASFVTSHARNASGMYHISDATDLVSKIPKEQGDVIGEAVNLVKYVTQPGEEATKLRGFLFFHFLGASMAAGVVNLFQTPMMTFPALAQYTGAGNVIAKLTGASKQAAMDPATIKGDVGAALMKAEREGITAPQQIHHLIATASNNPFSSNKAFRGFMNMWGGIFGATEVFNRRVAFIAAYEIARENGKSDADAYDLAKVVVGETQGIYNKGNKANLGRGALGSVVMTFKQFSIMYLELLRRMPPKQQLMMMGIMYAAAGLEGMPFAEDIEDVIDTLGQWLGYSTNTGKWLGKAVRNTLGSEWERPLLKGLGGMLPLALNTRLGMPNLIPGTAFFKPSEIDKTRDVAEAVGPIGGALQSFSDSLAMLARGKWDTAALNASPKAVKDAYAGVHMALTGESQDMKGRLALKDVSIGEALGKFGGFNPQRASVESEAKREVMQDRNMRTVRLDDMASDWADAILRKDQEKVKESIAKVVQWNRDNPEMLIDGATILRAVQERVKAGMRTGEQRFIKSVPRTMKPEAMQELHH